MKTPSSSSQNRAETVRNRRKQQSTETVQKAVKQARYPSEIPVVMYRGRGSAQVTASPSAIPRRNVSIPGQSGVTEMRLPALPSIKPGKKMLIFLSFVVLAALLFILFKSPMSQIQTIETVGFSSVTQLDIETALGVYGKPLILFNPADAKQKLTQTFPQLSDISVTIKFPASVAVSALERQPILAWDYDGELFWIDINGAVYPALGENTDLLVVHSKNPPPYLLPLSPNNNVEETADKHIEAIGDTSPKKVPVDFLKAVYQLRNILSPDTILSYDPLRGLGWEDPSGWVVYFGTSLESLDAKMNSYQAITASLQQKGIQPQVISIENVHAPYYRMEQ